MMDIDRLFFRVFKSRTGPYSLADVHAKFCSLPSLILFPFECLD